MTVAKRKMTPKAWASAKTVWQSDARDGHAWLVRELDLPVSRAAVSKRAKAEGWVKCSLAAEEVTQEVAQVTHNSRSVTSAQPETGRPSEYRDEYAQIAFNLCLLGFTREKLAEVFSVDVRTIYRWQSEHDEFRQALFKGGAVADGEVALSLYERAKGFSHPDEEIKVIDDKVVRVSITKQYAPDTGAARLWLTNRQPFTWKNKVEVVEPPVITIVDKEALDAVYEKALQEADDRRKALQGRAERLGLVLDGDRGADDDLILDDDILGVTR